MSRRRLPLLTPAVALALLLAGAIGRAELVATPLQGDSRLVQFVYDRDNTYLVLAKPKAVTHIEFAPDEVIQSVAAGDTVNWEFTPTKNRRNLFVKPKFDDTETSLTVLTDARAYQFVLRSTGEGRKWYQRTSWLYGQDMVVVDPVEAAQAQVQPQPTLAPTSARPIEAGARDGSPASGLRPDALRFSYQVQGNAPFRPEIVFDDGRFTYFKLPAHLQELPALFGVIDGKDFSLVNFEVQGDYMVAQRVLPEAVLRLGSAEVRVRYQAPAKSGFFSLGSGGD